MRNPLESIDVFILCGGLGKRLRPVVAGKQKVMAEIGEKPFLETVVKNLISHGFRKIIFGTGHLAEDVENYFKEKSVNWDGVVFEFSRENKPLGTGGAVKKALPYIKSKDFLVLNGDSFFNPDFKDFHANHIGHSYPLSMVLTKNKDKKDYGNVIITNGGVIDSFFEKDEKGEGAFISAGIYFMEKRIEEYFPHEEVFSLEFDVFPKLKRNSKGFVFEGEFVDIGTPERYESAQDSLKE